MVRASALALFSLLLAVMTLPASAQTASTVQAASCDQSSVNAVINGPTHKAVDGDVIEIPAGSCTWTSGITVPSHIGITIIGNAGNGPVSSASATGASSSCASGTTLTDDLSSGHMFNFSPTEGNSTTRLSCIAFEPTSPNPGFSQPVSVVGTCTSDGCPNLRLDNLTIPGRFAGLSVPDSSFADIVDVFGVADHNTVGDSSLYGNGVDLVNVNHPSWFGVGQFGDNSWAQPDSLGTAEAFYLENNLFTNAFGTDVDGGDTYQDTGGGRFVCRFNTFNGVTEASACGDHGTESTGRPRGGRQAEFYDNTLTCTNTSLGCASGLGLRSGVAYIFDNRFTAEPGSWFNSYAYLGVFRATSLDFIPWSGQGFGPYDEMAGASQTSTFKLSGVSGTCTYGSCALTVSSQGWTENQYAPGSNYYRVFDVTSGAIAGIAGNGTDTLTLSWCGGNGSTCYARFSSGDTALILGETLYASGTFTGSSGSTSFVDSTKSWDTNQWVSHGVAYILADITQGWACEIGSNTANTVKCSGGPHENWAVQGIQAGWNSGDKYIIAQVQQYMDPETRNGGTNFSDSSCGSSALVPTCVGYPNQTLDPAYEWGDTHTGSFNQSPIGAGTETLIANRDYYYQNPSFDGTSGTGTGTLAARPTTCTTGVAYWATDQGSWNKSGGSNPAGYSGQGELFECTATNTWSLAYTPYTYPYPLISGSAPSGPNPPKGLTGSVQPQ